MKRKSLIIVLVLAISIALTGCGKKKNDIVGKWAYGSFVYKFNKDKTCSYDAMGTLMKCTYEVNGNKLSILYEGDTVSFDTTYKIDGNKLIIKDSLNEDVVYTRK